MDWPSYLREVVSRAAVAAAGASAGVAAAAGGPIAIASAKAAAESVSDDLLTQFLGAHADQMQRIEELSQEIRGRLTGLQNTVGAQLDAPWHTALTHIEEAGRRPSHRAQELELARRHLIYAWGVAESLLERDSRSMDPAALRCPLVAQQIAAVYSFLGESQNTVHWLEAAYSASRNQLNNQIDAAYDTFAQKVRRIKISARTSELRRSSFLLIRVQSIDPKSKDLLWVRAPGVIKSFARNRELWFKSGTAERDLDFEGSVAALVALDAEAQLLRRTCLAAGT